MIYSIHPHALKSMIIRKVTLGALDKVIQDAEQTYYQDDGRKVFQSHIPGPKKKPHLLRAIVDMNENPPLVVTVISTSKILKYWRK
jgi:hypothetical protein